MQFVRISPLGLTKMSIPNQTSPLSHTQFIFVDVRNINFTVAVGNEFDETNFHPTNFSKCMNFVGSLSKGKHSFNCEQCVYGRYVTYYRGDGNYLMLCEFQVQGGKCC